MTAATIPDDLGVFLATTWRMHPAVCSFISDSVYEGRLLPEAHTGRRMIVPGDGGRIAREAGLLFVPVEHEGNTQGSDEEEAARVLEDNGVGLPHVLVAAVLLAACLAFARAFFQVFERPFLSRSRLASAQPVAVG